MADIFDQLNAALSAQTDQAKAEVRGTALLIAELFEALRAKGMRRTEAERITAAWVQGIASNPGPVIAEALLRRER